MARLSRLVRSALRRRTRRLPTGPHSGEDRPDRGRLLRWGNPAPIAAPAGGGGAPQVAVDRLRATGLRTAGPSGRARLRRYRLEQLMSDQMEPRAVHLVGRCSSPGSTPYASIACAT